MLVTLDEFDTYTNNHERDAETTALKTTMLTMAEETVTDYLGYNPLSQQRRDWLSGFGDRVIYVKSHNITSITHIYIDGVELAGAPAVNDDTIECWPVGNVWPKGVDNIVVDYTSGWTSANLPSSIKLAILNIAALKLQEANGNIGITGKSMDANSRTFINYTNFDKWLKPLDKYRVVRFQ